MIHYLTAACLYMSILFSAANHTFGPSMQLQVNSIPYPLIATLWSQREDFMNLLPRIFQIKVKLWIFQIMPSRHPASKVNIQETQRSHLYNYITFQEKTIFF